MPLQYLQEIKTEGEIAGYDTDKDNRNYLTTMYSATIEYQDTMATRGGFLNIILFPFLLFFLCPDHFINRIPSLEMNDGRVEKVISLFYQ